MTWGSVVVSTCIDDRIVPLGDGLDSPILPGLSKRKLEILGAGLLLLLASKQSNLLRDQCVTS